MLTRNAGCAITSRYLWKLATFFPPALRLLAHIEPPANDTDFNPLGAA